MKDIPIYGITEFTEADLSKVLYVNNLKKHLATHQLIRNGNGQLNGFHGHKGGICAL